MKTSKFFMALLASITCLTLVHSTFGAVLPADRPEETAIDWNKHLIKVKNSTNMDIMVSANDGAALLGKPVSVAKGMTGDIEFRGNSNGTKVNIIVTKIGEDFVSTPQIAQFSFNTKDYFDGGARNKKINDLMPISGSPVYSLKADIEPEITGIKGSLGSKPSLKKNFLINFTEITKK